MKVEYVNPFITGAKAVFEMLLCDVANLGSPHMKASPIFMNQVIILIGIVGKLSGQVYFEMSIPTAKAIASTMMGSEVPELDEMSKSAISEMGNMIMGNICTEFSEKKISVNITPPSLIVGDKIEISNRVPTIVVPLELNNIGPVNINITAEEVA